MAARIIAIPCSTADKASLVQSAYKSASSQKWKIAVTSTGTYKLTNVASSKAVATLNGGTSSGTDLMQTTYTGASTQIWTIASLYADPGFYKIASSANANLVVSPNGTIAEIATYIGADDQKWHINVAN
jgi:endo-1,4-beta-xylanase